MRYKLLRPGERKKVYAWLPVHLSDTHEIVWLEYVQYTYTVRGKNIYYSLEYTPKEPTLPKVKKGLY
jgi:hypothetical protein